MHMPRIGLILLYLPSTAPSQQSWSSGLSTIFQCLIYVSILAVHHPPSIFSSSYILVVVLVLFPPVVALSCYRPSRAKSPGCCYCCTCRCVTYGHAIFACLRPTCYAICTFLRPGRGVQGSGRTVALNPFPR